MKNDEIMELLGEEIKSEINRLSSLESGSEEHSTAVKSLAELYKLRIEEVKNAKEVELKEQQIDDDAEIRGSQLVEETKNRYLRFGLDVAGLILPLLFYGSWMKKGFRFEETGTFTSATFRNLFSRFRPTKK